MNDLNMINTTVTIKEDQNMHTYNANNSLKTCTKV
jgi:hypothetical protein